MPYLELLPLSYSNIQPGPRHSQLVTTPSVIYMYVYIFAKSYPVIMAKRTRLSTLPPKLRFWPWHSRSFIILMYATKITCINSVKPLYQISDLITSQRKWMPCQKDPQGSCLK